MTANPFKHLTAVTMATTFADNLKAREGCVVYPKKLRGMGILVYKASTVSTTTPVMPIFIRVIMMQVNEHITETPYIGEILSKADTGDIIHTALTNDHEKVVIPYTYNQKYKHTILYDKTIKIEPKTAMNQHTQINFKIKPKRRVKKIVFKRGKPTADVADIEKGSI